MQCVFLWLLLLGEINYFASFLSYFIWSADWTATNQKQLAGWTHAVRTADY
jgi:hypothetical protein